MNERFARTKLLFGKDFEAISQKRVIIFGAGGVGGFALDCLYRTGIKEIIIVDKDVFEASNQNRQIGSHRIGESKVRVLSEMYPGIAGFNANVDSDFLEMIRLNEFDYVIDAIDDIPAKALLAKACAQMPYGRFICSTGSAKKLNPIYIKVSNIWKSHGDKFARKLRNHLKKTGFHNDFKVVFSPESPKCKDLGSFSAVTASFGLQIASEVIQDILKENENASRT